MTKRLAQFTDGGAVAGATDKAVVIRSGTLNRLVTPVALDLAQVFLATQTVGNDGVTGGTGVLALGPTVTGASISSSFFKLTATLPTVLTDSVSAGRVSVTTAGSSANVALTGLE